MVPDLYHFWVWFEKTKGRRYGKEEGIVGEPPAFLDAAKLVLSRGFDTVVFGHTHHAGTVDLGQGKQYINAGSWLLDPHYVVIDNGQVRLEQWQV